MRLWTAIEAVVEKKREGLGELLLCVNKRDGNRVKLSQRGACNEAYDVGGAALGQELGSEGGFTSCNPVILREEPHLQTWRVCKNKTL